MLPPRATLVESHPLPFDFSRLRTEISPHPWTWLDSPLDSIHPLLPTEFDLLAGEEKNAGMIVEGVRAIRIVEYMIEGSFSREESGIENVGSRFKFD